MRCHWYEGSYCGGDARMKIARLVSAQCSDILEVHGGAFAIL